MATITRKATSYRLNPADWSPAERPLRRRGELVVSVLRALLSGLTDLLTKILDVPPVVAAGRGGGRGDDPLADPSLQRLHRHRQRPRRVAGRDQAARLGH